MDIAIFGKDHIYSHPTSAKIYNSTQPFDPEGVLGSLSSVFLVFLGLIAGKILLSYKDWTSRVTLWLGWCFILGIHEHQNIINNSYYILILNDRTRSLTNLFLSTPNLPHDDITIGVNDPCSMPTTVVLYFIFLPFS